MTWTNEAYHEMMKGERLGLMFLVIKKGLQVLYHSFTCKVKVVQYVWGRERSSVTLPCDVWRMGCGGFVWRLDVKMTLSLKLGS